MAKKKVDQTVSLDEFKRLEDQLRRALADYQNLEKRVAEGRSELTNFVGGELIKKLLPVLDHLDQALAGVSEGERESGWVKGVELAVKEFKQVLAQEGLEEIVIDPGSSFDKTQDKSPGTRFDPALHEAVDTREGDDNKILEVARKGYMLNGKVLRPAQVVVGKSQPEGETEEQLEKTVDTGDYA